MTVLAVLALALAFFTAAVTVVNLLILKTPVPEPASAGTLVSILIPARNEAGNIAAAVDAALASEGVAVEIVVMNDGSTDETAEIVARIAKCDARVRLVEAPALPEGWTGKIHACWRLAEAARGTHFLYIDADVRLKPAAAAAMVAHARTAGAGLVSAVPRQIMGSLGEAVTVPMINFLLLAYLPMAMMRAKLDPSLGAACGQMLLVEREAYFRCGGHQAIRAYLHDGIKLARLMRESGIATDLVRGADLATCRMYAAFTEAWGGFSKNAHEGMATVRALPVWTLLLFGGHVLPALLALLALGGLAPMGLSFLALAVSLATRFSITLHGREPLWTVPLHPVTVGVALAIQWAALLRTRKGRPATWRGRLYPAS
jgi:cellulose synthase/poly-beta-1,6-N-acetylglucosamine synthase-like glycosyltransferase